MTTLPLRSVLTAISLFGTALPGSVAAADTAANDRQRPMAPPSVQDLTVEADFTVFMAPELPAEIQRLALRQLWRLLGWESDGLGDYEADYTIAEPVRRAAVADDAAPAPVVAGR